jgi:hypothetical protein
VVKVYKDDRVEDCVKIMRRKAKRIQKAEIKESPTMAEEEKSG